MRTAQSLKPTPQREYKLTRVAENYLLSIYILREQGLRVNLTQLAEQLKRTPVSEKLGTSLPSVAAMIRRMAREGLVEITANKNVLLAPAGEQQAEDMMRRHRLAERMVTDLLGLELHKAHIEAHRLEHAISPDVEARIVERLGNPTTCPFGHPIPGSGYVSPRGNSITLDKARVGGQFIVDSVPEENQDLLKYLVDSKVLPGQVFAVKESAPYRGVVTLLVEGKDVVVGCQVASRIWVRKMEKVSSS